MAYLSCFGMRNLRATMHSAAAAAAAAATAGKQNVMLSGSGGQVHFTAVQRRGMQRLASWRADSSSDSDQIYRNVQDYYGRVLSTSKDLKTSACTASGRPPQIVIDALAKVPEAVTSK
eukprot:UC1_evm2s1798